MVINLVKKNVAEKQRGGEALAISVPSHDFSHDFWSVLMQVFFLADTLTTLPSRVDRPFPRTTLLLSGYRLLSASCVQQPPILSSAVLSTLIWSTYNHQSLAICCATSTPALPQACGAPHPEGPREALSQLGLVFFFSDQREYFF